MYRLAHGAMGTMMVRAQPLRRCWRRLQTAGKCAVFSGVFLVCAHAGTRLQGCDGFSSAGHCSVDLAAGSSQVSAAPDTLYSAAWMVTRFCTTPSMSSENTAIIGETHLFTTLGEHPWRSSRCGPSLHQAHQMICMHIWTAHPITHQPPLTPLPPTSTPPMRRPPGQLPGYVPSPCG